MAVTTVTKYTKRQVDVAGVDNDPYVRQTQLANVALGLDDHRHVPTEGTAIPIEALDSNVLKRTWFFAGLGGG